jgi:two-component system chemotaxis sensor kinase CheA
MEDKLLSIFSEESQEIIETLEQGLLALEGSDDPELINSVFRAAHTLKGNAGIVGFDDVVDLTHLMEGLLDEMRKGRLLPDAEVVGLLLGAVDALKVLVMGRLAGENPPVPQEVLAMLSRLLGEEPPGAASAAPAAPEPTTPEGSQTYYIYLRFEPQVLQSGTDPLQLLMELAELGSLDRVQCHTEGLPGFDDMQTDLLYLWWEIWLTSSQPQHVLEDVFIFVRDEGDIRITQAATQAQQAQAEPQAAAAPPAAPPAAVPAAPTAAPPAARPAPAKEAAPAAKAPMQSASIRVETDKLDKLVNLVGELVIGVARVNQISGGIGSPELAAATEALDHISRDLQEQVMRVRMIPVEGTFTRFQRVVRDLASEMGKLIHLEMSGTETELDKNVIEQIADPLKHLIRNSADHGLEQPAHRVAAGKPETGTIWLRAFQQEGKIIIEVADDGAGIDRNRVLNKAVERGLAQPSAQLSDEEIFSFMFQPGFSTAEKVTEVSGRGVGLDVVRQNIEALRGSVEVRSQLGQGTTFRIKLPLTLAIIDGMTVSVGDEILTIPLLSIVESLRPKSEELKTVESQGELVNVRGEYLPLVRLHRVLSLPTERMDPTLALVVIIESVSRRFGVLVDDILGEQQAVIKSLEQNYQKVAGIAGATILGDGRVSLILDIHGLEKLAFA